MALTRWSTFGVPAVAEEGLKTIYRTTLAQARLLSHTLQDPWLYKNHRYIARLRLQPVLDNIRLFAKESKTLQEEHLVHFLNKRLDVTRTHRRGLANANLGWEHAVFRALQKAYGRTGRMSMDQLSDLSEPVVCDSPVYRALLTSRGSIDGAPVNSQAALQGRPPPPFLPALDDPLVTHMRKGLSERRVRNATKKMHRIYRSKAAGRMPLEIAVAGEQVGSHDKSAMWAHLEAKARQKSDMVAYPPRSMHRRKHEAVRTPAYIKPARMEALSYSTSVASSAHRASRMREHGWRCHPRDFTCPRRQSRLYGRLLHDTPILVLPPIAEIKSFNDVDTKTTSRDPLGIRGKFKAACAVSKQHNVSGNRIKIYRSRYALGPVNKGAELLPVNMSVSDEATDQRVQYHAWMDPSEIAFLEQRVKDNRKGKSASS